MCPGTQVCSQVFESHPTVWALEEGNLHGIPHKAPQGFAFVFISPSFYSFRLAKSPRVDKYLVDVIICTGSSQPKSQHGRQWPHETPPLAEELPSVDGSWGGTVIVL